MQSRRRRIVLALVAGSLPALATIALAQPRAKPAVKPKPEVAAAPVKVATPPSGDAATEPSRPDESARALPLEPADGGRSSPLEPRPEELPGSGAVPTPAPVDYDRLLADIAALRARVATVADNLYQSRISVALQTDGDHVKIGKLTVSLDDGVVFGAKDPFTASDMTTVYEQAVAPGRHAVTVDVDRADARDETFRTSQRSRFTIDVPRDHRVELRVKIVDDSSMGADFASDRSGNYDLRFRVKAIARPVSK